MRSLPAGGSFPSLFSMTNLASSIGQMKPFTYHTDDDWPMQRVYPVVQAS
ncbi:MAG: hypothetical protein AAGI07_04280 [Bacteroidota bacterium]